MSAGRAERVRELADDALARADAAQARIEDLLDAVQRLRALLAEDPESLPLSDAGVTLDSARLVAIEMAVAGHSRDEVERHLRSAYGGPDVELVLDDVFGARASAL